MNSGFNVRTKQSDHWETPKWLYDALDTEFGFTLDPCPLEPKQDGLAIDWVDERVFCNPPYSNIAPWVRKASSAELTVLLLPVRTDTDWFRFLIESNVVMRFLRKRIRFLLNGKPQTSPRFASLIVVV